MQDLAIVYVAWKRYESLIKPWLRCYDKNFGMFDDFREYVITDIDYSPIPFFHHIKVVDFGVDRWSESVKAGIDRIPCKNIFLILDDIFFVKPIHDLFPKLYKEFVNHDMDSLRIRMKKSAATANDTSIIVDNARIRRLAPNSKYLVSYIPNIYKKQVLLDFLSVSESPWDSEVKGSKRVSGVEYKIYDYLYPDWYVNTMIKGKVTDKGRALIDAT